MFDQLDILFFLLVRICYIENYQREFQKEFYWLLLATFWLPTRFPQDFYWDVNLTRKFHTSFAFIALLRGRVVVKGPFT